MPIEQNGVKVKLLYKQEVGTSELVWGQPSISSQSFCFSPGYNPIGNPCSVEGDKMVVAGADIGMTPGTCYDLTCYASQTTPTVTTEIKLLKDNAGNIIHKRSNVTYVNENNAVLRSEIKTWGAEELNPPTPPTKQFYNFKHWESPVEGIIGTNTLAPITDAVYKTVYVYNENYIVDVSVNGGSYTAYEWDGVYTWNGVPAFQVYFNYPSITFVGLKNNPSIVTTVGTTVDIERNMDFPKRTKNIYPVDAAWTGFYGAMHRTSADLVYNGGNSIVWQSLGMPISFDGSITDINALIFVFENVV